jgi:hypothetical protein
MLLTAPHAGDKSTRDFLDYFLKERYMQKRKIGALAIALLLLVTVADASGILNYFRDRANDFLDMFMFRVSAARKGAGFGLHARATILAQAGWIYFDGEQFGMDRRGMGLWRERKMEGGVSLLYFTDVLDDVAYGNQFTDKDSLWSTTAYRGIARNDVYWDDGREHLDSIIVEAHLLILPGIEVGFYPSEAMDFIVGLLTLDPWEDDLARIERRRILPVEEAPEKQTEQVEQKAKEEKEQEVLQKDYQKTVENLQQIPLETLDEPAKKSSDKQ